MMKQKTLGIILVFFIASAIVLSSFSPIVHNGEVRQSALRLVKRAAAEVVTALNVDPHGTGIRRKIGIGPSTAMRPVSPGLPETGTTDPFLPHRQAVATGPLRVDPANPRYFMDGSGKAILLVGSHTWGNFQDQGGTNPPPAFDYSAYLDFLVSHHHNFFRLWTWEQSQWTVRTVDDHYQFAPMPFQRTGPGTALDGKPKFDLTKYNQAYFDRLRSNIIEARNRGIYVSIMLFDGWSVSKSKGGFSDNNPWHGHPYNKNNNVNGINGDPNNDDSGEEIETLQDPQVTALQEAYVRKVIDTVSDLDNVLYEICNESNGGDDYTAWQYHMINYIKSYEASKPKQHPVGMTAEFPGGSNDILFASPADWISPTGDASNPEVGDGRKVILYDTDHLCGICGDRAWVWRSLTRGLNPIFMDGYDGAAYGIWPIDPGDPFWEVVRKNLGYARTLSQRVDLEKMTPRGDLSSTGFALANLSAQGAEYLVYLVSGGSFTVDLAHTQGTLSVEWFNPENGETVLGDPITAGASRSFNAPFGGDAVLYLYQPQAPKPAKFKLCLPLVSSFSK